MVNHYIDMKNIKHHVEHIVVSQQEKGYQEQVLQELLLALTKPNKTISA